MSFGMKNITTVRLQCRLIIVKGLKAYLCTYRIKFGHTFPLKLYYLKTYGSRFKICY